MMVDVISTALVLLDADMRVVDLNPAAEALLEVSRKQLMGASAENLLGPASSPAGLVERRWTGRGPLTEHELLLSPARASAPSSSIAP